MLHENTEETLASSLTDAFCPSSGLLFDEWSHDPEIRQRQIEQALRGRGKPKLHKSPKKPSAPKTRKRTRQPETFPDTWEGRYQASLPPKPRCADDFDMGVFPVQRAIALNFRYLQFNTALRYGWLLADIDRPGAAFAWERVGLPAPNVIMENPENGHAHLGWRLVFAVSGANPFSKPMAFLNSVERGLVRRLQADRAFSQTNLVKNALHPDWRVHRLNEAPYELATLARGLDEKDTRLWTKAEKQAGLGRNVDMFNALRQIAYREALKFKADGRSRAEFYAALLVTAEGLNRTMGSFCPLPISELRTIVKSVAAKTWLWFTEEAFIERQKWCSARGHAKRWDNHTPLHELRPWEAEGISERTWYRRKKVNSSAQADSMPLSGI